MGDSLVHVGSGVDDNVLSQVVSLQVVVFVCRWGLSSLPLLPGS